MYKPICHHLLSITFTLYSIEGWPSILSNILCIYFFHIMFFQGLNNSLKYLAEEGLDLDNYTYSKSYIDPIMKGMHEVSFHGVSVSNSSSVWWTRRRRRIRNNIYELNNTVNNNRIQHHSIGKSGTWILFDYCYHTWQN